MKSLAVVGARLNSSRLPGKHLLPLAGVPLIGRIFERLDQVPELSVSLLATTSDAYNQPLLNWARTHHREALAYPGDVNDLVGRVHSAFLQHQPDVLIYICGDCPLIEPGFISRALGLLVATPEADYVGIRALEGRGVIHQGIDIYRAHVWLRLVEASQTPSEREHVGSARAKFIHELKPVMMTEPEVYYQRQHRISVDTPSDYRFMELIYLRWYAKQPTASIVSLAWVLEELDREPALAAINGAVHQKSVHETSAVVILVCQAGPQVGLGHLRRCLAVASALQDGYAAGVRLLILGPPLELSELALIPHRFSSEGLHGLQELVEEKQPQVIAFDLVKTALGDADHQTLSALQQKQIGLVSIDFALPWPELYRFNYVPSFFLDPSREGEKDLWGWPTYLLRGPYERKLWQPGSRLIVLTGGGDVYQLGDTLPRLLDQQLPKTVEVLWIQGPYAAAPQIPATPRLKWQIQKNPAQIGAVLACVHYGFCVYGVSLFEALAYGLPSVAFCPRAKMDEAERLGFQARQIAPLFDDLEAAVSELVALMHENERAKALSVRASDLVDGHGPMRLAGLLLEREADEPELFVGVKRKKGHSAK